MNFLLFYLLGCSFAYPIANLYFNNEILDNTNEIQEQLIDNKKFDKKFFKKATITFYIMSSWLIVIVFIILKLMLLYYIILNLFRK